MENLNLFLTIITTLTIGILGVVIYLNNRKSITNKTFFVLSLAAIFYGIVNYLSSQVRSPELVLWLLRFILFSAVWYSIALLHLFYVFPREKSSLPILYKWLLLPGVAFTSILTLTPLVFSGVSTFSPIGEIPLADHAPLIFLFAIVVLGLVVSSLILLIKKTFLSRGTKNEKQLVIILIGTLLTYGSLIFFNMILPVVFGNTQFIPFAPVFTLPFIILTSYAIIRHGFLNVKVFATELLVFSLWLVILIPTILSKSLFDWLVNGLTLSLMIVVGVFLVRSVKKEVEQREKLAVLNQKLQAAYDEVDRLSRAKSEFLSMASHQLRTPQTAIKGYLSMVLEGSYGPVSEKIKAVLEKTSYSNERLIDLVNDLLNVSRIESGTLSMDFEKISLEQIVSFVVDEMRIKADEKKVYLKLEKLAAALPKITIDSGKIRQVILNLIDNALKYTNKGGVTVKIKLKEVAALYPKGSILVEVKDTGEGLSKEELGNIFESFTRGRAGAKLWISGLGLGLYIAKKFTELHKGRVWAESEGEGKGSSFFMELPIKS